MRTHLFLSMIFLPWASSAIAQITTYQLSLKDSTQNILYTSLPNEIAIENVPAKAKVVFRSRDIIPIKSRYILTPIKAGTDTLFVYDRKDKLIFSKVFKVVKHEQHLQLGKAKYNLATVSDILAKPALTFDGTDTLIKPLWHITHYFIGTLTNGVYDTSSVSGDDLTNVPLSKEIQARIGRMKNGDRIFIESIKGYGPDGKLRTLNSILLTIAFMPDENAPKNVNYIELRTELRVVVNEIARQKEVSTNKDNGLLEKLDEVAKDTELIQLTNDKNSVVKCFAFQALATRKNIDLFPILMTHLNDTAQIEYISGDIVMSEQINEFMFLRALPLGKSIKKTALGTNEILTIDSLLLFTDITKHFTTGDVMLREMPAEPRLYNRVRAKALSDKGSIAVLILARYKNPDDVSIIREALEKKTSYSIEAAREFPDSSFYPFLVKEFDRQLAEWKPYTYSGNWGVLLQALAKYPSQETYNLFKSITELSGGEDNNPIKKALLIAINKFPNPIFEPLKKHIGLASIFDFDIDHELATTQW